MSTKHFAANVISATKVVPDGNYTSSAASGVWTLDEQLDLVKGDNWPNAANIAPGQNEYTSFGNYTFVVPAGYTSVSVVCIGAAGSGGNLSAPSYATGGGGGGGELRYKNNITVTPGNSYTVVVGRQYQNAAQGNGYDGGASTFNSSTCVANGGKGGNSFPNNGAGGDGGSGVQHLATVQVAVVQVVMQVQVAMVGILVTLALMVQVEVQEAEALQVDQVTLILEAHVAVEQDY